MMNLTQTIALLRRSFNDWNDDNVPRLGAALAFYTILSISPLVILAIAIVSLVFEKSKAQGQLLAQVQSLIGPAGKDAINAMLQSGRKLSSGAISTMVGFLTLAFGASGVFGELRSGLNLIWEVDPKVSSGWRGMLRERFFSLGMVVSVGFILIVSLLASAALAAMTGFFSSYLHLPAAVLGIVDFLVSLAGISLLFGLILKYVPKAPVRWSEVRVGAITTGLLFTAGKLLLGLYLGKTSPGSAYGAAGSLVVMVIWVYYAAQIFYFGAEFTHVVALSRQGTSSKTIPVPATQKREPPPPPS